MQGSIVPHKTCLIIIGRGIMLLILECKMRVAYLSCVICTVHVIYWVTHKFLAVGHLLNAFIKVMDYLKMCQTLRQSYIFTTWRVYNTLNTRVQNIWEIWGLGFCAEIVLDANAPNSFRMCQNLKFELHNFGVQYVQCLWEMLSD